MLLNYRKEIKVERANVSPMPSRRGTIDSEFAILISIFFTVPKAMHSSAEIFVSVRTDRRETLELVEQ